MTDAPTQPLVSPDGYWRWDGHAWVPNHTYPAYWGPPPAAPPSNRGKVIAIVVGSIVAVGLVLFVVLPMLMGVLLVHSMGDHLDGPFIPDDPVQAQLQSAGQAEDRYRDAHGAYTPSLDDLEGLGYAPKDGIDVSVVWAYGDNLCLAGADGDMMWYVSSPDTSMPIPVMCPSP